MTGEFIWVFFTPPLGCRSPVAVCQQDMFVNRSCLALERWYYLSHMCPTANKPVSLSMSSYVTEGRTEGWQLCSFMAPQSTRLSGKLAPETATMGKTNRLCLHSLQLPNKETDLQQFQALTWLRERPADRGSLWRWPLWRRTLQHKIKLLPRQTFTSTTKGLKSKEAV